MAAKPVSLTVHRNTVERHRKRTLARELTRRTAAMVRCADLRAYAVVGIAAEDTGAVLPMWAFADTVATVLRKDIDNSEVADDWRPALTVKGTRED
jgi:RNase P protein component